MRSVTLTVAEKGEVSVEVRQVLLAGYTGRDRARVAEHIRELAALGVAPPARVPAVYEVDPALLTMEQGIESDPRCTSGEAEFILLPRGDGEVLVGVGSDHTDREHEEIDADESKRRCPKVICGVVWRYAEVRDHWDRLELRSWVTAIGDMAAIGDLKDGTEGGGRRLYQEGRLAALLAPEELLREVRAAGHGELRDRVIFGGTLPAIGGMVFGRQFAVELYDPVLDRRLGCAYAIGGTREEGR